MNTQCSSKNSKIKFREMIKSGEHGLKKTSPKALLFQIMKTRSMLIKTLVTSSIFAWLEL